MTLRYNFILLALLIFQNSHAQKLIRKEITDINYNQVIYHVLEDDQNIKHGSYISFYPVSESVYLKNNKNDSLRIKEMGSYYFNLKNGKWITYDKPVITNGNITRGKVKASGEYLFNMKYGNWMEVDDQGKVQNTNYKIYGDTTGRKSNIIFYSSINYPKIALENDISGDVIIEYRILQDCSLDSIRFINKIGYGCEESAFQSILKNCRRYPCNNDYHLDTIRFRLF